MLLQEVKIGMKLQRRCRWQSNNWMDDFLGFIYRDRVHVLKSVPMEKEAKANQWNDTASTESIND